MDDAGGVARIPARAGHVEVEAMLRPYVASLALQWPDAAPLQVLSGSLAFVDISGFTRLTEILAGRGKAGAEELTGHLDRLFAELLGIAYAGGGELVKWGGDAVLVWFTDDGHAARAVDSAWRMQKAMARSGRLRTSAGRAVLRMSVGIHSGDFHFFLAGRRHRELLVTGPAATVTAHMEAVAEAGEIVVSTETAALLDPGCIGTPKQDGFLVAAPPRLEALPQVEVGARAVPRTAPATTSTTAALGLPSLCLPAELRDYLLAAPVESEHRQVAVAFVEFGGVDARIAGGDAAGVAADLDALMTTVQESCAGHGVTFWETDIAEDGGKVMLVAGAPSATGDDAGRMLAAVRGILDAGGGLRLRAGVNHGRVFVGGFGPPNRRTYSAKGDAVNLAARLMARARPGELLASDAALQRSRVAVAGEALEPFLVKGKLQPVQAHRVLALRERTAGGSGEARPLVGREGELAVLGAHLDAALSGAGRCVELVGAPGIGKSRLIEELQARTPGRVLSVVAQEYQSAVPYAAARVLLRQALDLDLDAPPTPAGVALAAAVGRLAPQLAPWLPLVAAVVGADVEATEEATALDERFRRQRLEEAVLDLLGAALDGPALLVVEDAEWADEASRSLLRTLAATLPARPWLLLVARRPGDDGALDGVAGVARMELQPLSREAVARVLRLATADAPLAPHQRDTLADRSGGNPLFLLELLGSGRQAGFGSALPDSVEGVFAAQIDRLAPAGRRLLRIASVLGVQVPTAVLAEMAGEGFDVTPLLGDFLTTEGADSLRFRHGMLRDAAYEGLPFSRRRELHALAARVLERRAGKRPAEIAGLLAVHFGHAGERAEEWRYARLAGERAQAAYAPVEASAFFEQALRAGLGLPGVGPDDLLAVAEALGDARTRLGGFAAAEQEYRSARRWATAALDRARLHHKAALAVDRAGNYPETLRALSRAEHCVAGDEGPAALRLRAEVRAQYGLVRHRQGRGQDAVRLLQEAVDLAEAAAAPDVLANALLYLDIAELTAGLGGDGSHARRALDISRRLGDQPWLEARALNQLGIRAYYAGHWTESVDWYAQSRQACERAGDRWTAAVESANIAEVLADQGHLAEAEPALEEALETYRASGTATFVADATRILGRLAARRGDAERGRDLLAAARAIYAADGEQLQVVLTDAVAAEACLHGGDAAGAAELAQRVLAAASGRPWRHLVAPLALRVLGAALGLLDGQPERASDALRESIDLARAHAAGYELALSEQALGDLWPELLSPAERAEREALFGELGVLETARSLVPGRLPEARV